MTEKTLYCKDCKKNVSFKDYNLEQGIYYCEECGQFIYTKSKDEKKEITKVNETDFDEAICTVIAYLCKNHNPHTKIIVECDRFEIVQGVKMEIINDYLVD